MRTHILGPVVERFSCVSKKAKKASLTQQREVDTRHHCTRVIKSFMFEKVFRQFHGN